MFEHNQPENPNQQVGTDLDAGNEVLQSRPVRDIFLLQPPRQDVPVHPCEYGFWQHPDFRWALIPPQASCQQYFADAGYVLRAHLYIDEFEDGEIPDGVGCSGWMPQAPGAGWFLVSIHDSEDGPVALFARAMRYR